MEKKSPRENQTLPVMPAPETNALACLSPLKPFPPREKSYLPRLMFRYEIQGGIKEGAKPGLMYLSDSEEDVYLSSPWKMCFLGQRDAMRFRTDDRNTIRSYADAKSESLIAAKKIIEESGKKETGHIALIAVIYENKVCIATFELYKSLLWYWQDILTASHLSEKKIADISLIDHDRNMVEGKSGGKYLSANLFEEEKDWRSRDISQAELSLILADIKLHEKQINKFISD